jgi:hypothetical protein
MNKMLISMRVQLLHILLSNLKKKSELLLEKKTGPRLMITWELPVEEKTHTLTREKSLSEKKKIFLPLLVRFGKIESVSGKRRKMDVVILISDTFLFFFFVVLSPNWEGTKQYTFFPPEHNTKYIVIIILELQLQYIHQP